MCPLFGVPGLNRGPFWHGDRWLSAPLMAAVCVVVHTTHGNVLITTRKINMHAHHSIISIIRIIRDALEKWREGGVRKICLPKMAPMNFSFSKIFFHREIWVQGGRGGGSSYGCQLFQCIPAHTVIIFSSNPTQWAVP